MSVVNDISANLLALKEFALDLNVYFCVWLSEQSNCQIYYQLCKMRMTLKIKTTSKLKMTSKMKTIKKDLQNDNNRKN